MRTERIQELTQQYRNSLLEDVIPFWLKHAPDRQYGGFLSCLDRDGSVFNSDKAMWIQCRAVWTFSKLYNEVERRVEWLDVARRGYEFITKYGFDADGRMFFVVTRDGQPLRRSRYLFTETFGAIAYAEYSKASGDQHGHVYGVKDLVIVDTSIAPFPNDGNTSAPSFMMARVITKQLLKADK